MEITQRQMGDDIWVLIRNLVCLVFLSQRISGLQVARTQAQLRAKERTEFLEALFQDYDKRVPPHYDTGKATEVELDLHISSFDSISATTMDYVISVFLRQKWHDPRLSYGHLSNDTITILDARMADALWLPDLFFTNEKRGYYHDIMIPNKFIRLSKNGTIYYSTRMSLTLACPMRLQKFPMDTQVCSMQMESYAYTTDMLRFKWREQASVEVTQGLELPQFNLCDIEQLDCTKSYITGTFTCLQVNFVLSRDISFYMIQTYVPSALIVMLSWVSFWITADAIPARISLGVLTILTMTTQTSGTVFQAYHQLFFQLPRVSYIKAIDVWLCTCLVFIFSGLLEFAVVNVLSRREIRHNCRSRAYVRVSKSDPCLAQCDGTNEHITSQQLTNQKFEMFQLTDVRKRWRNICIRDNEDGPLNNEAAKSGESGLGSFLLRLNPDLTARDVDKFSRKFFPLMFIVFNGIYWLTYFLWTDVSDNHGHVVDRSITQGLYNRS